MDRVQPPELLPFRDGERWVPAYLVQMMNDLETYKMTYDEAVRAANTRLARDHVNSTFDGIIKTHFRGR